MTTQTMEQRREDINARRTVLKEVFDQAGDAMDFAKVTKYGSPDAAANLESFRNDEKELSTKVEEYEKFTELAKSKAQLDELDAMFNKPVKGMQHSSDPSDPADPKRPAQRKDLGTLFVESDAYKGVNAQNGPAAELDIDLRDLKAQKQMKTVFSTGAGWDSQDIRIPRVIMDEQAPAPLIADVFPVFPTSQAAVVYMEETTFTNNAAEFTESTATTSSNLYGEAALALTEQTSTVRTIGVFLPVTDQQMEDVEGIAAYVNQRLTFMIDQRLDLQVVAGDGSAPNLRGTINVGSINTAAKSGSEPDSIYDAMVTIRVNGFANPSAVLIHPNDWAVIRKLTTADGVYIFGSPMDAGPSRIWGVPVVEATQVTENTVVVGDYANFAGIFVKRGIEVQVSNSHSHYFTRGMQAIRADSRIAVVHFRPLAFATITAM